MCDRTKEEVRNSPDVTVDLRQLRQKDAGAGLEKCVCVKVVHVLGLKVGHSWWGESSSSSLP